MTATVVTVEPTTVQPHVVPVAATQAASRLSVLPAVVAGTVVGVELAWLAAIAYGLYLLAG